MEAKIIFIIILVIILLILNKDHQNNKKNRFATLEDLEMTRYLMKELVELLDKNDITYWIIGGTLLGAVRHSDMVPWDDDIDIGIFESDLDKLLELNKVLKKKNMEIIKHWELYKIVFIDNEFPFVDIFLYKKDKEDNKKYIMNNASLREKWPDEYYKENELFPLKYYKFGNEYYKGPNFPLDYLDRMYWMWEFYGMHPWDHKEKKEGKIKHKLDQTNPEHKMKPYYFVGHKEMNNINNIFNNKYQDNIVVQCK
jgi:phosphorylcholine metabolism protein LicD